MAQQEINAQKQTGTSNVVYNAVSVLYHALQGGENYAIYANDAEAAGDGEMAQFFREMQEQEKTRAERAKELLKNRL